MGAHRPDQGPDGEKENAGFPEVAATGQKRLRKREIGLLDKTRQRLGDVALARAGQFKIAIAGLGARRVDAEGDDLTRACGRNLTQDSGPKIRRTGHQMVGGGDQNQRLGVCVGQVQRRNQHGRAGVARRRLDQDGAGIYPGRRQLFGHDEAEIGAGYNRRWRDSAPVRRCTPCWKSEVSSTSGANRSNHPPLPPFLPSICGHSGVTVNRTQFDAMQGCVSPMPDGVIRVTLRASSAPFRAGQGHCLPFLHRFMRFLWGKEAPNPCLDSA